MSPVEIAYLVVALAIVVLAIFLARFVYKATKTLDNVNKKMQSFDPLFNAVSNVSECLECKTEGLKEKVQCEMSAQQRSELEPYLLLAILGVRIWETIQKRR